VLLPPLLSPLLLALALLLALSLLLLLLVRLPPSLLLLSLRCSKILCPVVVVMGFVSTLAGVCD
jgi:hypothetical protein